MNDDLFVTLVGNSGVLAILLALYYCNCGIFRKVKLTIKRKTAYVFKKFYILLYWLENRNTDFKFSRLQLFLFRNKTIKNFSVFD